MAFDLFTGTAKADDKSLVPRETGERELGFTAPPADNKFGRVGCSLSSLTATREEAT